MEAPGTNYWDEWFKFVGALRDQGMIAPDDLSLFTYTNDAEEAAVEIRRFYNNYHSQRYVEGKLILRLKHEPSESLVAQLYDEFSDIIVSGAIEKVEATPAEIATNDNVDLPRIRLHFDRRHLGRLRMLVDRLNAAAQDSAL
jgi:hypothetical protein